MTLLKLCIFIFFARILDVSIGTLKTITLVKRQKLISTILSFIEVFIWYIAASKALTSQSSIIIAIFYSLGYATGTLIGLVLSNIFIKSTITLQIITTKATKENLTIIRNNGYAVSTINIENDYDGIQKKLLLLEVNSHDINKINKLINKIDNKAFIIYNESKSILNGYIK